MSIVDKIKKKKLLLKKKIELERLDLLSVLLPDGDKNTNFIKNTLIYNPNSPIHTIMNSSLFSAVMRGRGIALYRDRLVQCGRTIELGNNIEVRIDVDDTVNVGNFQSETASRRKGVGIGVYGSGLFAGGFNSKNKRMARGSSVNRNISIYRIRIDSPRGSMIMQTSNLDGAEHFVMLVKNAIIDYTPELKELLTKNKAKINQEIQELEQG